MKKTTTYLLAMLLMLFTTVAMSSADRFLAYDPTGTWEYELETPEGETVEGEMEIEQDGEDYSVVIKIPEFGDLEIEEVEFEESEEEGEEESASMSGTVDIQGNSVDWNVEFSGDVLEGALSVGGMELSFYAERE